MISLLSTLNNLVCNEDGLQCLSPSRTFAKKLIMHTKAKHAEISILGEGLPLTVEVAYQKLQALKSAEAQWSRSPTRAVSQCTDSALLLLPHKQFLT